MKIWLNKTNGYLLIISGIDVTSQNAADLSIYFDVGGIIGGILAGLAADFTGMSASVCSVMLIIAIPTVNWIFHELIQIIDLYKRYNSGRIF